jgi:hypothetical protein
LEAFDTIGRTDVVAASDSCEGANSDMLVMYRVCRLGGENTNVISQSMLQQIDCCRIATPERHRERVAAFYWPVSIISAQNCSIPDLAESGLHVPGCTHEDAFC